jgi:LuxR family maltose regulon positive regulatory protein
MLSTDREHTIASSAAKAPPGSARSGSECGIPPLPHRIVVRQRLNDMMDRGDQAALTAVCAPAGAGKTVMAASWARSRARIRPLVWVSLSDLGGSAGVPWALVVSALARAGFGPTGPRNPDQPAPCVDDVAGVLSACPERVTVILDFAADLSDHAGQEIARLLDAVPDHLNLVVLARCDVRRVLARLSTRDLCVVSRADLAFTVDEALELLHTRGHDASVGDVARLVAHTGGWVAGLVFAAQEMAATSAAGKQFQQFDATNAATGQYLTAEMLNSHVDATRRFLVRTSVCDVLHPDLVSALVGPSTGIELDELASGNTLMERTKQGTYRYSPVFRDVLRAELLVRHAGEVRSLFDVAAEWSATTGLYLDAVRACIAVDDWQNASRYAVEALVVVEILGAADTPIAQLVAQLPEDVPGVHAATVRAARMYVAGDIAMAADQLARAHALPGDGRSVAATEFSDAILRTIVETRPGEVDSILAATAAMDRLLGEHPLITNEAANRVRLMVAPAQAAVLGWRGELDSVVNLCGTAIGDVVPDGLETQYIVCLGRLAEISAFRGEHRRAVKLAREAANVAVQADARGYVEPATIAVALAWVYVETGDIARARQHLASASDAEVRGTVTSLMVALVAVRLRRAGGDLAGARETLAEYRRENPGVTPFVQEQLLAEEELIERLAAAPAESRRTTRTPGPLGAARPQSVAGAQLLAAEVDRTLRTAQWQLHCGEDARAVASVDKALSLAAPERLRRPFREAPAELRPILDGTGDIAHRHAWLTAAPNPGVRRRVADVPVAGERRDEADRDDIVNVDAERVDGERVSERLTAREHDVLRYLAELLTTEEVGEAMSVSVNTVRTHVRSILRKLGVARRNDAIRRAIQLGILS